MMALYRISLRMIEPDRRKNCTVYRYIVMADSLDKAKLIAVAQWHDFPTAPYPDHTLDRLAEVWGGAMDRPVYNCDIYGDKMRRYDIHSIPPLDAVRTVQAALKTLDTEEA